MLVLGIETTCDETACAVVKDGRDILSNVVFSQIEIHNQFGGVVPELACRRHIDVLIPVIEQSLLEAHCTLNDIDLFSVAYGPGLIGALLIGLNATKTLSLCTGKPFIGVNHVEAHLYAALMSNPKVDFPCLGIVLSGGHTNLIYMHGIGHYELIGKTVDDAIGEAFDKVAKILGLPYPGGPPIEALAEKGDPLRYPLKAGNVKGRPLDFSFSGLKTGVLYTFNESLTLRTRSDISAKAKAPAVESLQEEQYRIDMAPLTNFQPRGFGSAEIPLLVHKGSEMSDKADIAASFQHVAFSDIIKKTLLAAKKFECNTLVFGGGVTNNKKLRQMFLEIGPSFQQLWPTLGLSLDNAAMIAGLGYHRYLQNGKGDSLSLESVATIPF